MTDTTYAVVSARLGGSGSMNHVCCCADHDVSLCNANLTGDVFAADTDVDCVVCLDLDDTDECPIYGVCRA